MSQSAAETDTLVLGAWSRLALDLPRYHLAAPDLADFLVRLDALPPVEERVARLSGELLQLAALDVLMIEAFLRRHGLSSRPSARDGVMRAARVVARSLDIPPILTYPLYICVNPPGLEEIRRFTPTPDEFRFIRMHRLIEDTLAEVIAELDAVVAEPDPGSALARRVDAIEAAYRRANRTVAAFRSPDRIDPRVFVEEFRPYYVGRTEGEASLEGPSGLQSPTFRILAMRAGYADPLLDRVTAEVARYHEPSVRRRLDQVRQERDAGRSLAAIDQTAFPSAASQPHLHASYGGHEASLRRLAEARGTVSPGITALLKRYDVDPEKWPAGVPDPGLPGPSPVDAAGVDRGSPALLALARVEAMMHGFHLEHVATTAHHIGYARGTGGTSGVDFLLLAAFRRAAPRIWLSGLGDAVSAAAAGAS